MKTRILVIASLAATLVACSGPEETGFGPSDWPAYGGHNTGDRYSTLTQITPENVARLVPAWQFDMDDPGSAQTQPIVVDGVVFAITPTLDVIALDGASGDLKWSFPGLEPGDVVYSVLPLFHIYGLNIVLGLGLSVGAAIVIAAGSWLVWDQTRPRKAAAAVPAE